MHYPIALWDNVNQQNTELKNINDVVNPIEQNPTTNHFNHGSTFSLVATAKKYIRDAKRKNEPTNNGIRSLNISNHPF